MTAIVWHQPQNMQYEHGVDRGVFYPQSEPGVPWNGLVSVEESSVGGETESYYFDGTKYHETTSPRNFQATLTAFSAPTQFEIALGQMPVVPGFILTRQARKRFGLCYRTLVGDSEGYKIHLVYNAVATPNSRSYESINDSSTPSTMSWTIDATPNRSTTYQPSAHYILDSTKMSSGVIGDLENILYGYSTGDARLPTTQELLDLIVYWDPFIIVPETTSGLSPLNAGVGDLSRTSVPGIFRTITSTSLTETTTVGLYRLE